MNGKEQVKPANLLVEVIGETLERVHAVPSGTPETEAGHKSITLCFSNGKSIHLDAGLYLSEEEVLPVIRSRDGEWEMIEAASETVLLHDLKHPKDKSIDEAGFHEVD